MRLRALLLGAALLSAACEPATGEQTFVPGAEAIPGPGYFHVTGDPPEAGRFIVLRHLGSDGIESQAGDSFAPGATIVFDGVGFAGRRGLSVNGTNCAGVFPVEVNQVTDVVLRISESGCEVEPVGIRPAEDSNRSGQLPRPGCAQNNKSPECGPRVRRGPVDSGRMLLGAHRSATPPADSPGL
jgi:hypothetical protein